MPATVPPLEGHDADAGLPFDAGDLERRVTWIWGSPRSGSSWLLRQLCFPLEPDPERQAGFRVPEEGSPSTLDAIPVDEPFIANHLAPALGEPREVDGAFLPGTINNLLGDTPAYAYSKAFRSVWEPEVRRFALLRLHAAAAEAGREGFELAADARIVVKEVNGSHAADLVMAAMPRSRLLFLARDGRDVVDSLLDAYQPGGFLARRQGKTVETPAERLQAVDWAARMWACNLDATARAIEAHPEELTLILRYEELLTETETRIAAVLDWLELERSGEELRRMLAATEFSALPEGARGSKTRNRAARPGAWRENLSDDEQQRCDEILGSRLRRLGYEA